MADRIVLPDGARADARLGILIIAVLGEIFQGGLFFGWNALAIMIKDLGNYSDGCPTQSSSSAGGELCKSQESKLAILWTLGIFALNCGPVLMGFVLDYLGPKFTAIFGVILNMLGLILFGVSSSNGTNAFIPASIILGLGNITFHLAQFHISALFPRKRGLVSSVFVAGFTGSGIVMYLLLLIFEDAGSSRSAYIGVLVGYAGICALWVPLVAWIMPNNSFRVGMVYILRNDWRFEVIQRSDMEREYRRTTALQDFVAAASVGVGLHATPGGESTEAGYRQDIQFDQPRSGLIGSVPDSSDPIWSSNEPDQGNAFAEPNTNLNGNRPGVHAISLSPNVQESPEPPSALGRDNATIGLESVPLPPDVSWGPLIFEARRFVELRKKSFKEQFMSTESFGMGIFYTLNVFIMQFYLGTQRLQLDHKGDVDNTYSNFGNVVVAFAFVTIPLIGWLLDKKGYGWTLGFINALSVLTSVLQALPVLWLQSITLIVWMVARFFMYSSYFAIFGGLFGFRNFGRLVAIDNTFNGLFGLLQYPLTYLAIHPLDGNFTWINVAQVVVLVPLFIFCFYMWRWEREDLVPIRPLEGEELPCDMVGPRTRKEFPHIHLELPHIPNLISRKSTLPGSGH